MTWQVRSGRGAAPCAERARSAGRTPARSLPARGGRSGAARLLLPLGTGLVASGIAFGFRAPGGAAPASRPEAAEGSAVESSAPVEPGAQQERREAPQDGGAIRIDENTHQRLVFQQDVQRWAVGSPDILEVETLTSRELLARGKQAGRTSLIVWFADGTLRRMDVHVHRDLSLLEDALHDVYPTIQVQVAPDRDAVVLTGSVPLAVYARRAESVARTYLEARPRSEEFLTAGAAEQTAEAQSATGGARNRAGGSSVINLIRVEGLPEFAPERNAEEKIRDAIDSIGGERVTVRRIVRGSEPSDEADIIVLEGKVKDQVALTRVLSLAYKIFIGAVKGPQRIITDGVAQTTTTYEAENLTIGDDIEVIGDESGALLQREQNVQGAGNLLSGFGRSGFGNGTSGVSSSRLENRVGANIARAKALELADGRILSFIEVEDIPQVRVDIRLYEVNRTALLSWDGDFNLIASDFTQPSLEPAQNSTVIQGDQAPRVGASGAPDIQNVVGFLGGAFSNQLQYSGSNWAVDSLFSVLENEGIARGLAATSLSVLSGEVALFQVGGQVPVDVSVATPVAGSSGVLNSVQFIDFGVNLAVRPLVGEGDFITIDFVPEVSAPNATLTQLVLESTGTSPPTFAFESRLLRTSARLKDGNTLLVGGLSQTNRQDQSQYTPWLAKVPLLGLLFQGFDYSDDDQQVVVMVRPAIVRDPLPDAALWLFPITWDLAERAIPPLPPPPDAEGEAAKPNGAQQPASTSSAASTDEEVGQ